MTSRKTRSGDKISVSCKMLRSTLVFCVVISICSCQSVYEVSPPEEGYRTRIRGGKPSSSAYSTNQNEGYATKEFSQDVRPSRPRPSAYDVQQGFQGPVNPQSAYPVNPAQQKPFQPGSAYPINPAQHKPLLPAPSYPVKPPSAYPVNPDEQNHRIPDENAYGRPSNAYGGQSNAYGGQSNAYGGQSNVYGRPDNVYGNPGGFNEAPTERTTTTTTRAPVNPTLLSGNPVEAAKPEDGAPSLVITRDASLYAKDNLPPVLEPKPDPCTKSETTYNLGKPTCTGQLIFQDDFDILNPNKWRHDVRIPTKPDHEFVAYVQSKNNTKIHEGLLVIQPTLLSDHGEDLVTNGFLQLDDCRLGADSGFCSKRAVNYNILPPVLSAKIRTKHSFSFTYGRVEIHAKMPKGDWIYPVLWLEPKYGEYGRGYSSGRIVLGLTRGNSVLAGTSQDSIGFQELNAGCLFRSNENIGDNHEKYLKKRGDWGVFRNYSVLWTPDFMEFYVDGEKLGTCEAPNLGGRRSGPWRRGGKLAPFDEGFFLSIGVAAGGISEFPDGTTSGKERSPKPWRNSGAKALLGFFEEEPVWAQSWEDGAKLEVDKVRVYAL